MPNIKVAISSKNSKINNINTDDENIALCNCRVKADCLFNGICQSKGVVYQAKVLAQGTTKSYVGFTEGEFKTRYRNHLTSFNSASKKDLY